MVLLCIHSIYKCTLPLLLYLMSANPPPLYLNKNDVINDLELLSQRPVTDFQHLLCRTSGREGIRGGYWELSGLIEWVDAHGTDPLTMLPMNWSDYEAVSLNVTGESLLEKFLRQCSNYGTEIALLELQKETTGRRFTIQDRKECQYRSFRMLMKCVLEERMDQEYPWVYDYWVYHPYNPGIDAPIIQSVERIVEGRRREILMTSDGIGSWVHFRYVMAKRINATRSSDPGQNLVVKLYWECHPPSNSDNMDTLILYKKEAIKYNYNSYDYDYKIWEKKVRDWFKIE
jgi:hypothetical protein